MRVKNGELEQIGLIHSPYTDRGEAPRQGGHRDEVSTIEIFEDFEPALLDVESCTHLIVLYWQDRGNRGVLQSPTPWGPQSHGVFATRSPNRPNPIGICMVEVLERDGCLLKVSGLDALDGSPLIDIKPYSASIDSIPDARIGWHRNHDLKYDVD